MEMIRVITALCFILSLITLSHSASAQEVLGKEVSHNGQDQKQLQIESPVNPRKLKLVNGVGTVKNYAHNTHPSSAVNKQEEAESGKQQHHRERKLGRKGTRQEWIMESEFYTMDYHGVRRRRPIHNKSIPFRHP